MHAIPWVEITECNTSYHLWLAHEYTIIIADTQAYYYIDKEIISLYEYYESHHSLANIILEKFYTIDAHTLHDLVFEMSCFNP